MPLNFTYLCNADTKYLMCS